MSMVFCSVVDMSYSVSQLQAKMHDAFADDPLKERKLRGKRINSTLGQTTYTIIHLSAIQQAPKTSLLRENIRNSRPTGLLQYC